MMTTHGSSLRIVAVGDICPGDHYFCLGHGVRSSCERNGQQFLFAKVKHVLQQADVCFCNLEGVISDVGLEQNSVESIAFRGHPAMAQELRDAGFTIVNIANNHIAQHGQAAFDDTVAALRTHGLEPLGLKGDGEFSSKPVIIVRKGMRLGFLGYSLVPDPYAKGQPPYAMGSVEQIKKDVSALKQQVDIVLVSCHYGIEAMPTPSPSGIDFARDLADAGVDVFIGHHSHIFQPIEKYRNSIILYSLGNFVSDFFWYHRALESGVVEMELAGNDVINIKIQPVRTNRLCQPQCKGSVISSRVDSMVLAEISHSLPERELRNYAYYVMVFRIHLYLNIKKIIYFFVKLPFGSTRLKAVFLYCKFLSRFRKRDAHNVAQKPS